MAAVTTAPCSSELSISVVEKNTFITLVVEGNDTDSMHSMKPRRSRSLPPSAKMACPVAETKDLPEVQGSDELNTEGSTLDDSSDDHSYENHSWGEDNDAQTDASAASPDGSPRKRRSLADMLPDPPSAASLRIAHMHLEQSLSPKRRVAGIVMQPVAVCMDPWNTDNLSPTKHRSGFAPGNLSTSPPCLSLAESFGVPSDASPSKSQLRVSAKAFAPRGRGLSSVFNSPQAMQQHAPASGRGLFAQRCGAIIELMRQQLFTTRDVTGVEVRMGDLSWTVVVHLHKDVLPGATLESAKEALLDGARKSENVYVLGHDARPFVQTPLGFTATLCEVADSNAACWDLLSTGCCRRGSRCQWAHPEIRAGVTIIIKRVSAA